MGLFIVPVVVSRESFISVALAGKSPKHRKRSSSDKGCSVDGSGRYTGCLAHLRLAPNPLLGDCVSSAGSTCLPAVSFGQRSVSVSVVGYSFQRFQYPKLIYLRILDSSLSSGALKVQSTVHHRFHRLVTTIIIISISIPFTFYECTILTMIKCPSFRALCQKLLEEHFSNG